MPSKNKRRGNDFEREVVEAAKARGIEAQRAWGSDGRSMGMHAEVDLVIKGWKVQAKRRKLFPAWLTPNENVDVQVVRKDRGQPFIVMPLDTFLDLIED
jgi:Holliday junction resolvase